MSRSLSLYLLVICILLAGFLSACSGSGSGGDAQQSGGSGNSTSGTGGLSFQLVWQQPTSSGAKAAQLTPLFNACNDYAINTIAATVSNGTATVSSSFPCSAHQGLISGVPAGTNYTLHVYGLSSGPTTTTWSGQTSPITVTTGQTTNVGAIVMSYVGTDMTPPAVTLIGPNSSPTSSTNVPITDRIDIVFSKPMAISTITTTNITLSVNSTPISGKMVYSSASNTAAFIPSTNLAYGPTNTYVLQVSSCVTGSCITDTGGHSLTISSTNTFTFTTESAPVAAPTATPSGVTATPGNGQVTLDWLATNGSTSYNVYFSSGSPCTATLASTKLSDVKAPAINLGLTNGTTYCYIVTAVNGLGESLASAQVTTTPAFPATNPLPPASIAVDFNSGNSPYTITWPAVIGATSYNLYWSQTPISPDKTAADHVIRNVTSPYSQTVTGGQTYCYIVTAMNSNGESADSMQVCGPGGIQFVW